MPKSTKRFVLTSDNLNAQGFRMLTKGALMDDFEKNPLLLFNHIRPDGNSKDQVLPIGYWCDIERDDEKITAVPFFDDSDEFAMSIYHKVENGILKMASAGAEPLLTSSSPELLLPGQKKETVTQWIMKEASICDIGANPDCLTVALYDKDNKTISLSSQTFANLIPEIKMSKKPLSVILKDGKEEEIDLAKLSDEEKDELLKKLMDEKKDYEARISEMEEKLRLADEEKETKRVETLVSKAITQRKISASQKDIYIKLAKQDFATTEQLINDMKPTVPVKEALTQAYNQNDAEIAELAKLSFDELFVKGKLNYVKLNAPDIYKQKFKAKFGKEPQNV